MDLLPIIINIRRSNPYADLHGRSYWYWEICGDGKTIAASIVDNIQAGSFETRDRCISDLMFNLPIVISSHGTPTTPD